MVARTYYATRRKEPEYLAKNSSWYTGKAWEGYLKNKPRCYRNWLTKQVNRVCGCHGHLLKWLRKDRNREIHDECPSCGNPEPSTHVTRCEDPDRTALFMDSVS